MLYGFICERCHRYHRVRSSSHCKVQRAESTGDKRWQFETAGCHPKLPAGIRISSKKQWERVIKARGLTDDVGIPERISRLRSDLRGKVVRERRAAFREQVGKVMRQSLDAQRRLVFSGR